MKMMNYSLVRIITGLLLGLVLVIWPGAAVNYLVITVGVMFMIAGFIPAIGFLTSKAEHRAWHSYPIAAVGSLLLGLWLVIMPGFFANILMWILGFILILGGIQQIASLAAAKHWMSVSIGYYIVPVMILMAGIFSLFYPTSTRNTVFIIIGVTCLVYSVSELINYMKFTRYRPEEKVEDVEIIEAEEVE